MSVVDAAAAFECARVGHVPLVRFAPSVFVESWICSCLRCGRLVEFEGNPGAEDPEATSTRKGTGS